MKKLILMTSALTLMGGMANAAAHGGSDFTVTADASVSYGNWETGAAAAAFDYDTGVTVALEASSGDLTWGGEVSIDADAGTVSDGVIFVSGGFGKVSFGIDAFDEVAAADDATADINGAFGGNDAGDVKYEGTFGMVGVTLVSDAGLGNAPSGATWALGLSYSNGITASVDTDSTGAWELAVSKAFGGTTVGAGTDDTGAWDVFASRSFGAVNAKVTYDSAGTTGAELDGTSGAVGWALSGDTGGAVAASLSYDADPWTVSLAYDNDDAGTAGVADFGDEADFIATIGYKANDAVSFELKANDQSEYEISMAAGWTF